jgi:hypothetical protein
MSGLFNLPDVQHMREFLAPARWRSSGHVTLDMHYGPKSYVVHRDPRWHRYSNGAVDQVASAPVLLPLPPVSWSCRCPGIFSQR